MGCAMIAALHPINYRGDTEYSRGHAQQAATARPGLATGSGAAAPAVPDLPAKAWPIPRMFRLALVGGPLCAASRKAGNSIRMSTEQDGLINLPTQELYRRCPPSATSSDCLGMGMAVPSLMEGNPSRSMRSYTFVRPSPSIVATWGMVSSSGSIGGMLWVCCFIRFPPNDNPAHTWAPG
jgi:hypothetical protein